MTKTEFAEEAQRWYRGAGRMDDLTPERLAALWERYGHLPVIVWKNAVSTALLEPRWPNPDRLDQLVGKAEDNRERATAAERNLQVKGRGGLAQLFSGMRATSAFAQMCQRVGIAILDQKLTPAQAADMLTLECDESLVAHGMDCSEWVAAYREAGDDWRRVNVAALRVRPAPASMRALDL